MSTEEVRGRLVVTRVSPEGPADLAGVKQGDVVVAVGGDGVKTLADLYRRMWSMGNAGVDVPLTLASAGATREVRVRSIDRFDYFKAKKPL
jgi:S1-C subfamily serine protease